MTDIWDNPTEQNIGRLPLDVRRQIADDIERLAPRIGDAIANQVDRWLGKMRDPHLINSYFNVEGEYGLRHGTMHVALWVEAYPWVLESTKGSTPDDEDGTPAGMG